MNRHDGGDEWLVVYGVHVIDIISPRQMVAHGGRQRLDEYIRGNMALPDAVVWQRAAGWKPKWDVASLRCSCVRET